MLAPQLKQWESEGRYLTTVLFQHKVFCKDCGNPAAPPDRTLLLLHGLPTPIEWSLASKAVSSMRSSVHPPNVLLCLLLLAADIESGLSEMTARDRYCCKSRKSNNPKNLAKVDL